MGSAGETLREKIARVVAERVEIVPYDQAWPRLFEEEKSRLEAILPPGLLLRTEHFGSTSVPGLCAKPIVDVLAIVSSLREMERIAPGLEGETCDVFRRPTFGEDGPPWYVWLIRRGGDGHRTHHIHMVEDSPEFAMHLERLLFRDWLRTHPETACEYGELKMRLATDFAEDRVRYTAAKSAFIAQVMRRAKAGG